MSAYLILDRSYCYYCRYMYICILTVFGQTSVLFLISRVSYVTSMTLFSWHTCDASGHAMRVVCKLIIYAFSFLSFVAT